MRHTPIELRLCCLVAAGIEQLLWPCCLVEGIVGVLWWGLSAEFEVKKEGENEPKILARTSSTFQCHSIDDVLVTCYQ